ncbi:MAG: hypothetical protein ACRCZF_04070 [Gemmataceae bacterium]
MDEYLCVVLVSRPGEAESPFKGRISKFWSHFLRSYPEDFEKIYAEATAFEPEAGCLTRKYLVEASVSDLLAQELATAEIAIQPIDADDLYTKYEAQPPDWFWIEH